MVLSQKETSLLKDLKGQEKICVEKYNRYASQADDAQLKSLFTSLGQTEQHHYQMIEQMMQGTVPAAGGGQQQSQQQSQQQQAQQPQAQQQAQIPKINGGASASSANQQNDAYLCQDALSTEKHVANTYDISIFEFKDAGMRNALNHIQKEEQEHGKKIYDYMTQHNMYS